MQRTIDITIGYEETDIEVEVDDDITTLAQNISEHITEQGFVTEINDNCSNVVIVKILGRRQ